MGDERSTGRVTAQLRRGGEPTTGTDGTLGAASVHARAHQARHELPAAIAVGEYHEYFHGGRWADATEPLGRAGDDVDWLATDEWLAYEIDVRESGPYGLTAVVAAEDSFGGGAVDVVVDDGTRTRVSVPPTGGWYQWDTVKARVELPRGLHTLRFDVAEGGWKLREFSLR